MILFEIIFWFLLVLILYIYFGYPFSLIVIGGMNQRKKGHLCASYYPSVSLIIPAFNEEKVLEKKIKNVLQLNYPKEKLEIWIMSDGSTDRTDEIARKYISDQMHFFRQEPRQGKTEGLNKVIPSCNHQIIVFTDANSMYEPNALIHLVAPFQNSRIGLVCGKLKYLNINDGTEYREGLYWKYEDFLKSLESKLGQLLVVNGSIYAIRKELFQPLPAFIADDFGNPMVIGSTGHKLIYEPRALVYEYTASNVKEEFHTKLRIITRGLFGTHVLRNYIFNSPFLRMYEFVLHKYLRWHVPFLLILILIFNLILLGQHSPLYMITFLLQVGFYVLAVLGYLLRKHKTNPLTKLFMVPYYFCEVNAAALLAFERLFKKKPQATWESARSTRK